MGICTAVQIITITNIVFCKLGQGRGSDGRTAISLSGCYKTDPAPIRGRGGREVLVFFQRYGQEDEGGDYEGRFGSSCPLGLTGKK